MKSPIITINYSFIFNDNKERKFNIELDTNTLNLIQKEKKSLYPQWTELNCCKCPNCPLDKEQHKYCPIAVNLVDIIDFFRNHISFEEVDVVIDTEERKYLKHTSLQKGASSLIGIYMVTSGCPIMEMLKPMVRYHLPFATLGETKYRIMSMYLFAQYFLYKLGKLPDWDMKKLIEIYDAVKIVNENFCKRLLKIKIKDAVINALIGLDCFASIITFSIEAAQKEIEPLFNAYFKS